jgi:hypothetical protein
MVQIFHKRLLKKHTGMLVAFVLTTGCLQVCAQHITEGQATPLFLEEQPLILGMNYSIKVLKEETNDSTYVSSMLLFTSAGSGRDSMKIRLRARGNYRREHCYYVPLKLELNEADTRATPFEGISELKLVLPCLTDAYRNDYVLKEYLAYKLYEHISPYHYKTRLVQVDLYEDKGRRTKEHELLGFFIEDKDQMAKRLGAIKMERKVHPLFQDPLSSVQNNMFEYLIANTDYSTRLEHNQTLLYVGDKYVSVPYDFDMSGLVNAPYAAVSNIQHLAGSITEVTQRIYKGYRRDTVILQQVRRQFLSGKEELMGELNALKPLFGDDTQYRRALDFLEEFFEDMNNDSKFERQILERMRDG